MELRGQDYRKALDACGAAVVACEECAEVCIELGGHQELLRSTRDCIGIAATCMNFLARGSTLSPRVCEVTAEACRRVSGFCAENENEVICRARTACAECEAACASIGRNAYVS
jgi:hypothetical protein